jgi:hypothetical protein
MAERSVLDLELRSRKSGRGAKEATAELQGFEREVEKAKKLGQDFGKGMLGAAAALAGFGLAAGKAFEFGKAGAELDMVQIKFRRLSDELGLSSTFMERLERSTGGVVSEFGLMESATNLMSLGLVKNEDDLRRLIRVSGELGFDMNQLVLTMTNMTTMRFDALGLSVDGFKDKVKALEAQGLSAADAFREAFLRQAENQLERVGSVADTTLGAFKRLEAQIKNISDQAKLLAADALEPVVRRLGDSFEATNTLRTAVEMHIITEEHFDALQQQRARGLLSNTRIMELYGAAIDAVASREERVSQATSDWNRRLEEQAARLAAVDGIQPTLAIKMELETEDVFTRVKRQLELMQRGAAELSVVATILPEVDWSKVDPALRDMILGQGQALAMMVEADIQAMSPEQQAELKQKIAEATDVPPAQLNALWDNFQQYGSRAVQRWAGDTLGLLQGTVSPAMQAAVQPLLTGVGRFTRSLDALDGRHIRIYADFLSAVKSAAELPGYQHGGQFMVRGLPGPDRNLVQFRASDKEVITITPAGKTPPSSSIGQIGPISVSVGQGSNGRQIVDEMMLEISRRVRVASGSGAAFVGG